MPVFVTSLREKSTSGNISLLRGDIPVEWKVVQMLAGVMASTYVPFTGQPHTSKNWPDFITIQLYTNASFIINSN